MTTALAVIERLPRMVVPKGSAAIRNYENFAKRVSQTLKYDGLKKHIQNMTFLQALDALGLPPFDSAAVTKYKAEKMAEEQKKISKARKSQLEYESSIRAVHINAMMGHSNVEDWVNAGTRELMGLHGMGEGPTHRLTWALTPLFKYKKQIPITALEAAMKVKETIPASEAFIEHLTKNRIDYDPFLVVRANDRSEEIFHIWVWDEPGFKL